LEGKEIQFGGRWSKETIHEVQEKRERKEKQDVCQSGACGCKQP
jgi:hypothetical protein